MEQNSPSSKEDETPTEEVKPEMDKEGLLKEYDVIICGTGLVQSILASALSRAGKQILHCDGQEHYGELDAVLNLAQLETSNEWTSHSARETKEETKDSDTDKAEARTILLELSSAERVVLHSMHKKKKPETIEVGTEVVTPYGIGSVTSLPTKGNGNATSIAISLQDWTLANGKNPIAYFGVDANNSDSSKHFSECVIPTSHMDMKSIFNASCSFALDLSPGLLYASGTAVQGLLTSKVADYVEFKSVQGLFWLDQNQKKSKSPMKDWQLSRVPCSKSDVFGTKLLAPMDKRRLMKFLQLTLDYATSVAGEQQREDTLQKSVSEENEDEVQSLNERILQQGRSLARPQNKAVSTEDLQTLKQCIAESMDFDTFLTQKQRLSSHLVLLVRHALALETSSKPASTLEGMTQLCHHVQALGRYGTTAFLVPLYGSGELSQAFCRSAAVHGATYLLRRPASAVVMHSEGQEQVRGIVLRGEDCGDESIANNPYMHDICREDKIILAKHVIVCSEAMIQGTTITASKQRILRRISILRGKLIVGGEEQRHVIVVPPNAIGNTHAIHGIALDESVHVAPRIASGCTVLHLTTTVDASDANQIDDSLLRKAVECLVASQEVDGGKIEEIYHASFSYALASEDQISSVVPQGLHICRRVEQNLAVDNTFEQARRIFQNICPNSEFLELSEEMDSAVKERLGEHGEEEDQEGMVLESAMNMLDTSDNEMLAGVKEHASKTEMVIENVTKE